MKTWVLFDWGDTLMRVLPGASGKMRDWPRLEEMSGVRHTLHQFHGAVGLALATNAVDSDEADIRAALTRVNLQSFFKHVFCARALGVTKGDPAFYPRILEALHADPGHAVMVGDGWTEDVEAARAAGLWTVWFNARTDENRTGTHTTTLHHLEALPAVLRGWGLLGR
jgi:HAD superfamily hydrolase (TIGR01509 family)